MPQYSSLKLVNLSLAVLLNLLHLVDQLHNLLVLIEPQILCILIELLRFQQMVLIESIKLSLPEFFSILVV